MTIAISNNTAVFSGSGSAGPFSFTFPFFANSQISAAVASPLGIITDLVQDVDYTISTSAINDVGAHLGGSITLTNPLASGYTLTITRTLPILQGLELPNQQPFFAPAIEAAFDYLTMICQQLNESLDYIITRVQNLEGGIIPPEPIPGDGQKIVMVGDLTLSFSSGMKMILFLDPNGADRNVNFIGTYPIGFEMCVFDLGANVLVLDSVAAAIVATPGPGKSIYFDGIKWYEHS